MGPRRAQNLYPVPCQVYVCEVQVKAYHRGPKQLPISSEVLFEGCPDDFETGQMTLCRYLGLPAFHIITSPWYYNPPPPLIANTLFVNFTMEILNIRGGGFSISSLHITFCFSSPVLVFIGTAPRGFLLMKLESSLVIRHNPLPLNS